MDNGLKITDLKTGEGDTAEKWDRVTVDYTGTLEDGTVFDSSIRSGGGGIQFVLGGGQVIAGWDQGIMGMKVGGERKLVIPPDLGYGTHGAGNVIPPNATLIFDVKLVKVEKPEG